MQFLNERERLCKLCSLFYSKGWVSGTGGGISLKVSEDLVLIAPSGVQKELLNPEDLFLVKIKPEEKNVEIIESNPKYKISACTDIFVRIYISRPSVRAIIHSHSIKSAMLTKFHKNTKVVFSKYEMLKGIKNGKYSEPHTVPIIDNVEYECDLADDIEKTSNEYPESQCILVRDHGVYVWGDSWEQAKVHAECYDYLFETKLLERQLGIM